MKYVLFIVSILVIFAGCAMLAANSFGGNIVAVPDGVYEGVGAGYRGPIHVQVCITGGNIIEIAVMDSTEDRFVGGEAIEELLELVIQYNTTDIDVISGATESSKGFLEAVDNAILNR